MLKLQRIEVENFGPFKGSQTIEFPENGIAIIYGENQRGKTKLLNAIRYALFGKVITRESREESLHLISNWEAAKEGIFGFRVRLEFSNGNSDYVLTRQFHPKVEKPDSDYDYQEEFFLQRNGSFLSHEQRDAELQQIMPEQVSRFFLFDGELLQEYEELLRQDSNMGQKITQAIERILGVPVLTNSRAHLRELHREAQRDAAKAAQRDQETQQLGIHHEQLTEERRHHEEHIDDLKDQLAEKVERKLILEQDLRKSERIRALFDDLDRARQEVKSLRDNLEVEQNRLRSETSNLWKSILAPKLKGLQASLQDQQQRLQNQMVEEIVASFFKQALDDERCPVCDHDLDTSDLKALSAKQQLHTVGRTMEFDEEAQNLYRRLNSVQQFIVDDRTPLIEDILIRIENLRVEIITKEDFIQELDENVSDVDQSQIRALYREFEAVVKDIGHLEDGINEENDKVAEISEQIKGIENKLADSQGFTSSRESRKSNLYLSLFQLFSQGVDAYREHLRQRVEADATDLFRSLTSEEQYDRLIINDNYGLQIVHQDGDAIPVRSAGAEHIVALSLMGALQKNAPLRGPIIMDSPFGRLDEVHTDNVVRTLTAMADQVVLLVYRGELQPERVREILGGDLRNEYKMTRISARHTALEPNWEY